MAPAARREQMSRLPCVIDMTFGRGHCVLNSDVDLPRSLDVFEADAECDHGWQ